jgi:Phosphodiester glycosidase
VLAQSSPKSQILFDSTNRLQLSTFSFDGRIAGHDFPEWRIFAINAKCQERGLSFFTSYRDSLTKRDSTGTVSSLRLLSSRWMMNDTLQFIVGQTTSAQEWKISTDECLLAERNAESASLLSNTMRPGDTLRIYFGFSPAGFPFTQLISGWGRLLQGGVNLAAQSHNVEGLTEKFTAVRHPRTFVGFNADTSKLYLCTVDGRQKKSIGMTFVEMANFLLAIGASDGFNLDGGGSTEMVVKGQIMNSPSDAQGERAVANSLQVIWKGE